MFDPQWLIIMKADASDQVLNSVLSQKNESENLHLVAFHSCKFTESELNYKIHNKELLAIVKAFKQWKTYLKESKNSVQVYTDHKNLIYFTTIKVLNHWQVQWSEKLSNFNFDIHYQKRFKNVKADALSRRPDYMRDKPQTVQSVLSMQWDEQIIYNRQIITATMIIINNTLKDIIRKEYLKNKQAQQVFKELTEDFEKTINRLILFQRLVYIFEHQQNDVIQIYYDDSLSGH